MNFIVVCNLILIFLVVISLCITNVLHNKFEDYIDREIERANKNIHFLKSQLGQLNKQLKKSNTQIETFKKEVEELKKK